MDTSQAKRIIETVILCASEPLPLRDLREILDDEFDAESLKRLLLEVQQDWVPKGMALVEVATGWRFQSNAEMAHYIDKLNPEKPQRYSRAALETLAIIAYKQPVTRGDIEDIRGVTVNSQLLRQLEDRDWIEVIGQRQTTGRPDLFATTRNFLNDLGLTSLEQLPTVDPVEALTSLTSAKN